MNHVQRLYVSRGHGNPANTLLHSQFPSDFSTWSGGSLEIGHLTWALLHRHGHMGMQEQVEKELGKMCASANHSAKLTHARAATVKFASNNGECSTTRTSPSRDSPSELHRRADIGGTEPW